MYFIGNCTYPRQASICTDCGEPTGRSTASNSRSHEAAPGNKRLGRSNQYGVLSPDSEDTRQYKDYTIWAIWDHRKHQRDILIVIHLKNVEK